MKNLFFLYLLRSLYVLNKIVLLFPLSSLSTQRLDVFSLKINQKSLVQSASLLSSFFLLDIGLDSQVIFYFLATNPNRRSLSENWFKGKGDEKKRSHFSLLIKQYGYDFFISLRCIRGIYNMHLLVFQCMQ